MSKLCQCRRAKLLDRLWDIPDPYEDLVNQQLEDVEKILESDCVCEKKEDRNLDCPNKCTVDEAVDRGCIYCANKAVYKSKQSQSPCDHEWWKMKDMVFERVLPEKSAYWNHEDACLYNCFKCGLVTCLNPNDK